MNTTYLVLAGLYLVCLGIRLVYEQLKKADRAISRNALLFGFVAVAMALMWTSWFSMCPLDPFRLALPGLVRWTGLGALIAGTGLALGAFVQLRGVENIDHLVTTGLFARIRHPMYTGFILWVFGWAVYHGALLSLAIGLVGVGNILYWRRLEDVALESRYGDAYRDYRKQTWF